MTTLNLPTLPETTNTLYFGIGGGYDICGAIPLHETIQSNAVFVNVGSELNHLGSYDPFYSLDPHCGVLSLAMMLQTIVDRHSIDTIIAIDGGVDGLMQGNEENSGTVLQDFISLAALDAVNVPNVIVAFLGFGCETDEQLNHYAVLNNIARLTQDGAFVGSCSLTTDNNGFRHYKRVVEDPKNKRKSHIHSRVIAAAEGLFGVVNLNEDANLSELVFNSPVEPTFINPLMNMYWFFTLEGIVGRNQIIPHIKNSQTITEALMQYRKAVTRVRPKVPIPL